MSGFVAESDTKTGICFGPCLRPNGSGNRSSGWACPSWRRAGLSLQSFAGTSAALSDRQKDFRSIPHAGNFNPGVNPYKPVF